MIENAKISATTLGQEDHGLFTCAVHMQGSGWGCSFGGYPLDEYSKEVKRRVGTAYGLEFIKKILSTLEIREWEKLPGTVIRVDMGDGKVGSRIKRIGHFMKDKWFDPEELLEECKVWASKHRNTLQGKPEWPEKASQEKK